VDSSPRNGELGWIDDAVLTNDDSVVGPLFDSASVTAVLVVIVLLGLVILICCCRCPWKKWRKATTSHVSLQLIACWNFQQARRLKRRHAEIKRARLENWGQERARRRALGLGPRGGGTFGGGLGGATNNGFGQQQEAAMWSSLKGGVHSVAVVQGMTLIEAGQFERAVEVLSLACSRNSSDVDALFQLGRAYEKLFDFDSALAAFQKVLLLDPRDCASLTKCGICLEALGQDPRTAIDSYRTALKLLRSFGDKAAAKRRANEASAAAVAAAAAAEAAALENGGKDEAKAAAAFAASQTATAAAAAAAEAAEAAEAGTLMSESQVKQLVKYTLFNLGRCFEDAGYLKEAVATFTQLTGIAQKELEELDHLKVDDFKDKEAAAANALQRKKKQQKGAAPKRLLSLVLAKNASFVVSGKKKSGEGGEGGEEEGGVELTTAGGKPKRESGDNSDSDHEESKDADDDFAQEVIRNSDGEDDDDDDEGGEEGFDEDEREARQDAERIMKAFQEVRRMNHQQSPHTSLPTHLPCLLPPPE
jgi:tetratricopeptide (TPR) repeat protein